MAVDRSEDRHAVEAVDEGKLYRIEQRRFRHLRRAAALRPDRVADQRGQAIRDHVDRGARDDLVGALIDRGVAMDEGDYDRHRDAPQQAQPGAAGEERERRARKCAGEHLALEADVDDARAFGPEARQTGQDQRHAEPDAGAEDLDEGVEHLHAPGPQIGGWVMRRASSTATGRRNMCSSAPANSTTRP